MLLGWRNQSWILSVSPAWVVGGGGSPTGKLTSGLLPGRCPTLAAVWPVRPGVRSAAGPPQVLSVLSPSCPGAVPRGPTGAWAPQPPTQPWLHSQVSSWEALSVSGLLTCDPCFLLLRWPRVAQAASLGDRGPLCQFPWAGHVVGARGGQRPVELGLGISWVSTRGSSARHRSPGER